MDVFTPAPDSDSAINPTRARAQLTGPPLTRAPGAGGAHLGAGARSGIWRLESLAEPLCDRAKSVDSRQGAMGARSIGGVRFPPNQPGTSMTNQPISMADRPTGERSMS